MVDLVKSGTGSWRTASRNLGRAALFVLLHDDQPPSHRKIRRELLNSAVIFAVATLDAYLHDVLFEVATRYGPTASMQTELQELTRRKPDQAIKVILAPDWEERNQEFRSLVSAWLGVKSFQGVTKVIQAAGLLDYVRLNSDLAALRGPDALSRLDAITELRHSLVHRLQGTTPMRPETVDAIDLIYYVFSLIDRAVCDRYEIVQPDVQWTQGFFAAAIRQSPEDAAPRSPEDAAVSLFPDRAP